MSEFTGAQAGVTETGRRLLTVEGSSAQQKTRSDLTMELGMNADLA